MQCCVCPPTPARCKGTTAGGSWSLSQCLFSFSAERCPVCSHRLILCRVSPPGRGRSHHLLSPAGEQALRICTNSQEVQRQILLSAAWVEESSDLTWMLSNRQPQPVPSDSSSSEPFLRRQMFYLHFPFPSQVMGMYH